MKFCFAFILVVTLVFHDSSPTIAQPRSDQVGEEPIPGVLFVKYEQGVSPDQVALSDLLDVQSTQRAFPALEVIMAKRQLPSSVLDLRRVYRMQYSAPIPPQQAAQLVSNLSGVVYAEPLWPRFLTGLPQQGAAFRGPQRQRFQNAGTEAHPGSQQGAAFRGPQRQGKLIPNDPLFEDRFYMKALRMTEAWDHVKGEDGNVVVAIVDGGTDWRHEDLVANVWTNPGEIPNNNIDDDENGFVDDLHGWNFENSSNDPTGSSHKPLLIWHGTIVAGIATAVANNRKGTAGTSWNAKFMPINATCEHEDVELLCFNVESVLYAALSGADIINASYAGFRDSRTERATIQAAMDMGTLVVAAASNEGIHMELFRYNPAGYPETLSVCGTQLATDSNVHNYGYTIDVCAASVGISGPEPGNRYGASGSGTSFAAPLVSGIAALVKTAFPDFSPEQVREQLRATAVNIDGFNRPSYAGLLGRGRVDAYRAVTDRNTVSARLTDWKVTNASGNRHIAPGELVTVDATIKNYLAEVNGYTIDWIPNGPHFDMEAGSPVTIGPMSSGDSEVVQFSFRPHSTIPYRFLTFIEPRIRPMLPSGMGDVVSGGDAVRLVAHDSEQRTHRTGAMTFDITSEGNFGWVDFAWISQLTDYPGTRGSGFTLNGYASRTNQVRQAGLVIGVDQAQVLGSVLELPSGNFQNQDFTPSGPMEFYTSSQGQYQYSRVELTDAASSKSLGLNILQEVFTDLAVEFSNVAVVRYTLHNSSTTPISGIHTGLYFDWQLWNSSKNIAGIDALEGVSYTSIASPPFAAGLKVITPGATTHSRSYRNEADDHLLEQLWNGMSNGMVAPDQSQADWVQMVSAGPYHLAADADAVVEFAILGGEDLPDLQNGAHAADELLRQMNSLIIVDSSTVEVSTSMPDVPDILSLQGNYPNPFIDRTTVAFTLPEPAIVEMEMLDILGRRVLTVGPHSQGGGPGTFQVERGHLAAGVYVYSIHVRSHTDTSVMTGKLIIAN